MCLCSPRPGTPDPTTSFLDIWALSKPHLSRGQVGKTMGSPLLTPPRPSLDTPWLPLLQRQPAIRGTWKHLSHILTLSGVAESLGSHCGVECPRPTHPCKAPLGPEAQPQRHWDCWITALVHRDCLPGDGCQAADGGWHSLPSQEPAGPKGLLPSPAPRLTLIPRAGLSPAPPAVVPGGCCAVWGPLSSL